MSADTLRRAAALMRDRATASLSASPWSESNNAIYDADGHLVISSDVDILDDDIPHIASWHPAVALAVADWIEDAAENLEMQSPSGDLRKNWDMRVHIAGDKALAVARAYLGESA